MDALTSEQLGHSRYVKDSIFISPTLRILDAQAFDSALYRDRLECAGEAWPAHKADCSLEQGRQKRKEQKHVKKLLELLGMEAPPLDSIHLQVRYHHIRTWNYLSSDPGRRLFQCSIERNTPTSHHTTHHFSTLTQLTPARTTYTYEFMSCCTLNF